MTDCDKTDSDYFLGFIGLHQKHKTTLCCTKLFLPGYIARLLEAVQEGMQNKALRACVAMTADDPPPLSNSARKVSKVELVQKHKTRFNR